MKCALYGSNLRKRMLRRAIAVLSLMRRVTIEAKRRNDKAGDLVGLDNLNAV